MQIEVHGRHLDVTPPLRAYAEKKAMRLERFLPSEARLDFELSVERNPRIAEPQVAELTINARGEVLRVKATAADMYAAMDLAVDRMKRTAAEYHDRHSGGRPHHAARPVPAVAEDDEAEVEDEDEEQDLEQAV
jgi:ribosomal subunit interface protein